MRFWTVAVFDGDEAQAIKVAQRSINVAYPTGGPDDVAADDPRRSVLRGLSSRNDPLTAARLRAGLTVLRTLADTCERESRREHWMLLLGGGGASVYYNSLDHDRRVMVDTLVDARQIQHREALIALEVILVALRHADQVETELTGVVEDAREGVEARHPCSENQDETARQLGSPRNADRLMESLAQAQRGEAQRSLHLSSQASGDTAQFIEAGLRRGPIKIPTELWEPVFRPTGRFRLPLHLEWSGSERSRWRNARDIDSLLTAYIQVMVEGSVADIVTWVDPKVLAANFDQVLWPRCYETPWRAALERWGLL